MAAEMEAQLHRQRSQQAACSLGPGLPPEVPASPCLTGGSALPAGVVQLALPQHFLTTWPSYRRPRQRFLN